MNLCEIVADRSGDGMNDTEYTYKLKDYEIPSEHDGGLVRIRTLVPTAHSEDERHEYPLLISMHGGGASILYPLPIRLL